MYGNIIVRGIGRTTPAVAPGFAIDQVINNTGNVIPKILFVEVPQTGQGLDTPNFSLIAQGSFSGLGMWTFGICLTPVQSNKFVAPTNSPIASAGVVIADALQHSYVFEADVAVVAGVPQSSSPWTLTVDGSVVATGTCINFPTFVYPVGPANGEFATTPVILRTLVFSFSAVSTAVSGAAIAVLNIAEAGYGKNMPITTVNGFLGSN
jgi:hypothetical protein